MPKLTLLEQSARATHRVLVFGGPKSGKTELVGKLAQYFNLIWFDCEQGWSTLTKFPQDWKDRIRVISIPDSRTYPIAAETWLKVIKGLPVDICEAHGKVGCALCKKAGDPSEQVELNLTPQNTIVVFDSLTQFSNSCMSHITKNQPDDYKPLLDDWGYLRVLIDKFLSQVQAAQYNIVCITHEEEVEMEDGKSLLVPVSGSSKSSRNTAKYFDHVVYCQVKNKKHLASSSTTANLKVLTGSRTGIDLEKETEQSLLSIFKPIAAQPPVTTAPATTVATQQTNQGVTNASTPNNTQVTQQTSTKTASQLALERLKNKAAT